MHWRMSFSYSYRSNDCSQLEAHLHCTKKKKLSFKNKYSTVREQSFGRKQSKPRIENPVPNIFSTPMIQGRHKKKANFSFEKSRAHLWHWEEEEVERCSDTSSLQCLKTCSTPPDKKKEKEKMCGDNPACSHLTKQAQSIIPLAPLC